MQAVCSYGILPKGLAHPQVLESVCVLRGWGRFWNQPPAAAEGPCAAAEGPCTFLHVVALRMFAASGVLRVSGKTSGL